MADKASVVRYARRGEAQIAYRVVGSGPPLVALGGTMSGIALAELPMAAPWMERLVRFSKVVLIDPRGTGSSDPLDVVPTLDDQAADVLAVLDDAGIEAAFVHGHHAGVGAAIALAVSAPERVLGLVLVNGWARLIADEDCPWGLSEELSDRLIDAHRETFGTGMFVAAFSPSRAHDADLKEQFIELERRGSSRAQSVLLTTMAQQYDIRERLPRVQVPTVVMHSRENTAIPVDHARYLAARISDATLVEFDGTDHAFMFENPEPVLIEIEALVTGIRPLPEPHRVFGAIVFTDLVGSTARAALLGDRVWRNVLERHDANGAVALGVRLDLSVRVGVHAGEVDERDDDLAGVAVNLSARLVAVAGPGEVIVSATVRDIVSGASFEFRDRGTHSLKGFTEPRHVYELI